MDKPAPTRPLLVDLAVQVALAFCIGVGASMVFAGSALLLAGLA